MTGWNRSERFPASWQDKLLTETVQSVKQKSKLPHPLSTYIYAIICEFRMATYVIYFSTDDPVPLEHEFGIFIHTQHDVGLVLCGSP